MHERDDTHHSRTIVYLLSLEGGKMRSNNSSSLASASASAALASSPIASAGSGLWCIELAFLNMEMRVLHVSGSSALADCVVLNSHGCKIVDKYNQKKYHQIEPEDPAPVCTIRLNAPPTCGWRFTHPRQSFSHAHRHFPQQTHFSPADISRAPRCLEPQITRYTHQDANPHATPESAVGQLEVCVKLDAMGCSLLYMAQWQA